MLSSSTVTGDKINFGEFTDDVTVDPTLGVVIVRNSDGIVGTAGLKTGEQDGFDSLTTGSGDDRIFGNSEVSEIFDAGDGYNQISAGDSDGTFDWVDYSGFDKGQGEVNPAEGLTVAASTNPAGKEVRSINLAERITNLGEYQGVGITIGGQICNQQHCIACKYGSHPCSANQYSCC